MGVPPHFVHASHMNQQELMVMQQFYFNIVMNMQDLTVEQRLKRAEYELSKLIHSQEPGHADDKFSGNPEFTYQQIKKILTERILTNRDILNHSHSFQIMTPGPLLTGPSPFASSPAPQSIFGGAPVSHAAQQPVQPQQQIAPKQQEVAPQQLPTAV